MKSMVMVSMAVVSLLAAAGGAQTLQQVGPDAPPPLPRYREGGTPYDPSAPIQPYAIEFAGGKLRNADIRSVPEYGPTRGVLYRYFSTQYASVVTACVAALTSPADKDEIAYVTVTSASQQTSATSAFTAAGANMSKVVFLTVPGDSVWMRDYGPHFIIKGEALGIVDSHYYPTRPQDNFVPTLLGDSNMLRMSVDPMGLYYSGGNFQPGPNRTGFCTSLMSLDNTAAGGFTSASIAALFDKYQGIDTLHVLGQLPFSVDGTGHIDMWNYLIDENHCIVGEFIPGSNATAISVTNAGATYMAGLGFTVYRTPNWNVGSTHYTYTNAYRVNNRIFVPVYGTAIVAGGNASYNDEDATAMSTWNIAVGNSGTPPYNQVDFSRPKVTIVPIQCNSIIPAAGAIHCIIKQVPRHQANGPAVYVSSPSSGDIWVPGTTQRIAWSASDDDNVAIPSFSLYYSLDNGNSWQYITTTTNANSFDWTVPNGLARSPGAKIKVVANASDMSTGEGINNGSLLITPGTVVKRDFSSGANVDKFGWGFQTTAWTTVNAARRPAVGAVSAANLGKMGASDASGGDTDTNRYISPTVGSTSECTHTYEFTVTEDVSTIDQIVVIVEGYSDNCTQSELYVWDYTAGAWADGKGNTGQNNYMANYAGNRDDVLVGRIDGNFSRYIDANGQMTFLLYSERQADEQFTDYMSLTVIDAVCPSDFDASGFVDFDDYIEYVEAFELGDQSADFDGSGFVDFDDFIEYVIAFESGC